MPAGLLLALAAPSAFAWGVAGHRTIAMMAEKRLSPQTLNAVHAILGPHVYLSQVAPCPDEIRGDNGATCAGIPLAPMPQSEPWHFIDMEIADPSATIEKYCSGSNPDPQPGDDPLTGHDCVVGQIFQDLKTLKDPSASKHDKQLALIFLVHLVGDEHQPLHCADDNDRGGNQKTVHWAADASMQDEGSGAIVPEPDTALAKRSNIRPEGAEQEKAPLNLHSLWDHIIEPKDSFDPFQLSAQLGQGLGDGSPYLQGDFVRAAAQESFDLAKGTIYPAYRQNQGEIDPQYQSDMQKIAFRRLQIAAVRLAALLESALGAPAVVPAELPHRP